MTAEKLDMKHLPLLRPLLKEAKTYISEYSFANLFLFRNVHEYEVVEEGDVFLKGRSYDGKSFIFPVFDVTKKERSYMRRLSGMADYLFPIPEEKLALFDTDVYDLTYLPEDSDYVYTTEKLAGYKGSKMHDKRNLLNQFLSLYTPSAQPLTADRMKDAKDVLDQWQADVGEKKEETDYFPCIEAFEMYDDLVLCGGMYYVNKEPAGFIIGEEINSDLFALHFAKGKRKFKGLYQYMFNNFANILPKKYVYMNFEQDMGKLALKIAKSSYNPDLMVKKYRVSLRKGI